MRSQSEGATEQEVAFPRSHDGHGTRVSADPSDLSSGERLGGALFVEGRGAFDSEASGTERSRAYGVSGRQDSVLPQARTDVLLSLLQDAGEGSAAYASRWLAGRGAE